ncbi:50S ribosomal protein L21 domain protein [Dictyocaulus viviparus]|uniref:50S ribosomal protein L21 domain protein n=1 Tax=Dictyocaulus viviparus TaxID=29172 RepID=A0A0D8Y7S3_DICVI|nr:50S ribosomal protein L21 domain protein [Dictyocaulus viviparus]
MCNIPIIVLHEKKQEAQPNKKPSKEAVLADGAGKKDAKKKKKDQPQPQKKEEVAAKALQVKTANLPPKPVEEVAAKALQVKTANLPPKPVMQSDKFKKQSDVSFDYGKLSLQPHYANKTFNQYVLEKEIEIYV